MFRKKQKLRRLTQKLIDKGLDPKSEAGSRFLHFLSERNYDNYSIVLIVSGGSNIIDEKSNLKVYDHNKGMTLWLVGNIDEMVISETYNHDSTRVILARISHV